MIFPAFIDSVLQNIPTSEYFVIATAIFFIYFFYFVVVDCTKAVFVLQ